MSKDREWVKENIKEKDFKKRVCVTENESLEGELGEKMRYREMLRDEHTNRVS